uniref:Uncharacterized protein n=1 Tax=Accipiter nisus TaxID=211598 RepID=A0A8B9RRQ6_9AVES
MISSVKSCSISLYNNTYILLFISDFRDLCLLTERSGDTISNELLRVPEKNAFKPRWSGS